MSEADENATNEPAWFPFTPPDWPVLTPEIRASLERVISTNAWGKYDDAILEELQHRLAEMFAMEQVHLCSSGTIAVELALRGVGVQESDEVLLAGYDFPGNFRAIEAVGATPVLIDLQRGRWNMDLNQLRDAVSDQTKAILVSHLHGDIQDIEAIRESLAGPGKPIKIVEDNCQSPGGQLRDRPLGSFGDVSTFSFGGSKLLSAGRGGAVLSNDPQIIQRIRIYAHRGNDAFPMSVLQAAVLLPQLEDLAVQTKRRFESAIEIRKIFPDDSGPLHFPKLADGQIPGYYKLGSLFDLDNATEIGRDEFLKLAQHHGIPLATGFRGFAKRTRRRCRAIGNLANAKKAAEKTVLIHHPVLLAEPRVIHALCSALEKLGNHFQ